MALLLVIKGLVAIALDCVFLMSAQPRYQLRTIEKYYVVAERFSKLIFLKKLRGSTIRPLKNLPE